MAAWLLELIAIRDVPVDNSSLSKDPEIAATEPVHLQIFVGRNDDVSDESIHDISI